jgi:hypothetical protein
LRLKEFAGVIDGALRAKGRMLAARVMLRMVVWDAIALCLNRNRPPCSRHNDRERNNKYHCDHLQTILSVHDLPPAVLICCVGKTRNAGTRVEISSDLSHLEAIKFRLSIPLAGKHGENAAPSRIQKTLGGYLRRRISNGLIATGHPEGR